MAEKTNFNSNRTNNSWFRSMELAPTRAGIKLRVTFNRHHVNAAHKIYHYVRLTDIKRRLIKRQLVG